MTHFLIISRRCPSITAWLVGLFFYSSAAIRAQEIPAIPPSLQFGGINVKLDNSARTLIESDVKSLIGNKRFWEDKLDRAVLYFPIIEGILIEEEVPIDFKYLAVQESSLMPDAVSTSNAVGFWQFKQETALEVGLRVDSEVDERKSISASSRGAALYLKRNNLIFNNWVSTLYSYYQGAGGANKALPANWAYAREVTLTSRTDRYILRFFAHKIAMEVALDRYRTTNSVVLFEYPKAKGVHLDEVSRSFGVSVANLRRYNQWLNSDLIPDNKDYTIVLPVGSDRVNEVREKLSMARIAPSSVFDKDDIGFPVLRKASVQMRGKNDPIFYEINGLPGVQARPGDKAADLARAAKVSTSSFLRYNDMRANEPIIPNEVYYLARKKKKAMVPFHTVREGETLRSIAQTYGIQLPKLMKYNRLTNKNQRLQTGRVMWLMKKRPAKQPVEVIEEPSRSLPTTEPILSPAPSVSERQPTAATGSSNESTERKKYTPKLVESSPTNKPSPSASGTTQSRPSTRTQPTQEPPPPRMSSPSTSERVIVITDEDDRSMPQRVGGGTTNETKPRSSTTTPGASTSAPTSTTSTARESEGQYHIVEAGQTYFSISRLYNLTVDQLLTLNQRTANDRLAVGQRLLVRRNAPAAAVSTPAATQPTVRYINHTVSTGETLFRISQKYGVTMEEIQQANNMADTNVKLGQTLRIPTRTP